MKYKKQIIYSVSTLLLFGLLVLLEMSIPNFARFFPIMENKLLVIVLNVNLLLILLLLFLATRIILKSYLENRREMWGSGLKKRLTTTFLFISIIPSITLFVLSTGFFYVSMDRWFGEKIENTVDNAFTLSQYYYEDIFQRYGRIADLMSSEMTRKDLLTENTTLKTYIKRNERVYFLEYLVVQNLATGTRVTNNQKDILEKSLDNIIKQVVQKRSIREIIPVKDGEMIVLGRLIVGKDGAPQGVLLLGDKMKVQGTERIKQIAAASKEFKESRVIKKALKYSFVVPLLLITILTIFVSMWVGVKMAAEITVPIEKIKEGASIIAKGKFDINLEDKGKDEIGTLVSAFNSMAKELQVAREEIEERRRYMEVILDNVATGIISTDQKGTILLINRSAKGILGLEGGTYQGIPLKDVLGDEFKKLTKSFMRDIKRSESGSVTRELRLNIRKDVTYIRASLTTLTDEANRVEGFIIAFDDISHIVRAEKLATWREVARKLTHEIKNPLTPIVLSAERIRRKIMAGFQSEERDILDETTSVIINSAEDIKGIVNELTKLSRISQTKAVEDLNIIVEETIDRYKNLYQHIGFTFGKESIPLFRLDKDGIKRALINLIANSVKALEGNEGTITVKTRYEPARGVAVIEFSDTGKGIPHEDKGKVFDPYFTKDGEGTGLGLAIVHSIILEHHGKISIEDNVPKGTRFIIELPVIQA